MVNLSAVNMTEVAVLRAKLKEKEIEVDSLNAVLQKQGKSLQQFQGSSVDDAKKRQDALLRAHVARSDKLEAENEALRDNLKREENARRAADDDAKQARDALQAAAEMAKTGPGALSKDSSWHQLTISPDKVGAAGGDPSTGMSKEGEKALKAAKDHAREHKTRIAELNDEVDDLKKKLEKSEESNKEMKDEMIQLRKKLGDAERRAGKAQPEEAPSAAAFAAAAAREETKGLPAETYNALQQQRQELTKYIMQLEEKLELQERSHGKFAREREAQAHASMAERCSSVTKQLRVAEAKLARATSALDPTVKKARDLQEVVDDLQLRESAARAERLEEAKLRVTAARMALNGYRGLREAAAAVAELRGAVGVGAPAAAPAPAEAMPFVTEPPPAAAAASATSIDDIAKLLVDAISTVDGLAPFSASPRAVQAQVQVVRPSVYELLHLMSDTMMEESDRKKSAQQQAALARPTTTGTLLPVRSQHIPEQGQDVGPPAMAMSSSISSGAINGKRPIPLKPLAVEIPLGPGSPALRPGQRSPDKLPLSYDQLIDTGGVIHHHGGSAAGGVLHGGSHARGGGSKGRQARTDISPRSQGQQAAMMLPRPSSTPALTRGPNVRALLEAPYAPTPSQPPPQQPAASTHARNAGLRRGWSPMSPQRMQRPIGAASNVLLSSAMPGTPPPPYASAAPPSRGGPGSTVSPRLSIAEEQQAVAAARQQAGTFIVVAGQPPAKGLRKGTPGAEGSVRG